MTPVPGGVGPMTIAMVSEEHGLRRTGAPSLVSGVS